MNLECTHIVLNVADVPKSREFYVDRLNLEVIEEHPRSFAVRAGHVRLTISPAGDDSGSIVAASGITIIFRVDDIDEAVTVLKEKGVQFASEILEAPGFMKFIAFADPDGNELMLGEYLRNPLDRV